MATPRFASALATDADFTTAVEHCATEVVDALEGAPDLALVFASPHHSQRFDELGRRVREATGAAQLVGCSGASIVAAEREIEGRPALSVLGVRAPKAEVRAVGLEARRAGDGFRIVPELEVGPGRAAILLVDPFTFPIQPYLAGLGQRFPGAEVVGGMASGGRAPGEHALWLGDETHDHGAVALLVGGGLEVRSAVSQGCRPVGDPLVVTACDGNAILKLRGRPATKVLIELLEALPERDRELFRRGPHVGLAMDATKSRFTASDLLVRNVIGLLPKDDGIAVGDDSVRVGMTVQFMLRDAASASDELAHVLSDRARAWGPHGAAEAGALLFTCGGRGSHLFGTRDHDARAIEEHLGPRLPLAG